MSRSSLVRKVELFLRRLEPAGGMVVAVSGGPDSVALLRALLALSPGDSANRLVIAHLNHQLRGAESDADEDFVRKLYQELAATAVPRLELRSERLDVAAEAQEEGSNLEQTARRIRYDWLARVAREAGLGRVATGHTADDQAETVLHRLLRGAGLKGLRGIAARRALCPGIELVRPLLRVTRGEVLAYLEAEKQAYRHDRSNLDLSLTRNRIRHELLPLLVERFNPAIAGILSRLAEQADSTFRRTEALVRKLLAEVELPRAGPLVILDRLRLNEAPPNLVREVFRLLWEREGWPLDGMNFAAWERLAALARGETPAVDLPGGVRARLHERVVQIGRDS